MKDNKGSVTLYVILAMLTLSAFLMAIYMRNANAEKIQLETTARIKETYEDYNFNEVYETIKNYPPKIKECLISDDGKTLVINTYKSDGINVDQNGKKILYYAVTTENTKPSDDKIKNELGSWQNNNEIDISSVNGGTKLYIWVKNEDNIVSNFETTKPEDVQEIEFENEDMLF